MDWNKFARDVHQTAVKNGLWDKPRSFDEVICECLVHLGRAYEEHRSGRPNYYHLCQPSGEKNLPCDWDLGKPCQMSTGEPTCEHRSHKPHGAAVELGECVLGLLDYMGNENVDLTEMNAEELNCETMVSLVSFPALIVGLVTSLVLSCVRDKDKRDSNIVAVIYSIFEWVRHNNIDLESILRELHGHNKARAGRREGATP